MQNVFARLRRLSCLFRQNQKAMKPEGPLSGRPGETVNKIEVECVSSQYLTRKQDTLFLHVAQFVFHLHHHLVPLMHAEHKREFMFPSSWKPPPHLNCCES